MKQSIEDTKWFTPEELSEDEQEDVLDEEELAQLVYLAEHPELECFEVAHAEQGKGRWSK